MKLVIILMPLLFGFLESKGAVKKSRTSPYCQPQLCEKRQQHVACGKFSSLTSKTKYGHCRASQVQTMPMFKETILKLHNDRRSRLANGKDTSLPIASRMVVMKWSPELATVADFNARMCEPKHDDCRSTKQFPHSGQNIFVYNTTRIPKNKKGMTQFYKELFTKAITAWWSQSASMTFAERKLYSCDLKRQKELRHFATMAVENNTHVGCAGRRYVVRGKTQFKLTCNYARSPVCGQPIYKFWGCERARNKKYSALCSNDERFR